ncbi:GNAT family N-acetyltransferase [Halosegnis marinus]|uniref:GNAT family N-acetyltransferase n=1 Tax=Halosegnis marinus TaxID=3034023 RepID=UPI0036179341
MAPPGRLRPARAAGEGIGAALADRVEADARAAGADRVRLVVLEANEAARAFYEARGYRATGEREESVVEGTTEAVYELEVRR